MICGSILPQNPSVHLHTLDSFLGKTPLQASRYNHSGGGGGGDLFHPWTDQKLRVSIYAGRLFGVNAEVALNEHDGVAALELSGVPVGGCLVGQARFNAAGGVHLDTVLGAALSRRFVSVLSVRRTKEDVVEVVLRLPVMGVRKLEMHRFADVKSK